MGRVNELPIQSHQQLNMGKDGSLPYKIKESIAKFDQTKSQANLPNI